VEDEVSGASVAKREEEESVYIIGKKARMKEINRKTKTEVGG
jgi:hypothetical protein